MNFAADTSVGKHFQWSESTRPQKPDR